MIVAKVGGSLLDLPDLKHRLDAFIESVAERVLFVIGGGAAAEQVRIWDQHFQLGPQKSHELALLAMDFNARGVASLEFPLVSIRKDHSVAVLGIVEFLNREEVDIPASWDFTSDSIGAFVARRWPAERLILLKSIPAPDSLEEAATKSAVDPFFCANARGLAVGWCNLRGDPRRVREIA